LAKKSGKIKEAEEKVEAKCQQLTTRRSSIWAQPTINNKFYVIYKFALETPIS